ncbi:MAG TPA: hypothetical protein VKA84_18335 [Gemmatimonadaceae bacterium]|nr:hypothetical protein [Gemmatimonadaceae bacterium]
MRHALLIARLALTLGSLGCGPEPPDRPASAATVGLRTYRGDGFTLAIPADAQVHSAKADDGAPATVISARAFTLSGPSGEDTSNVFTNETALYTLEVSVLRKAADQPLARWADSVVAAENGGEPNEDERMAPADTVTVAGELGYLIMPSCGDCSQRAIFVARGPRVVRFSYIISSNEPLGMIKEGVYGLLLSTFRWEDPR